jgi:hypothetical protein
MPCREPTGQEYCRAHGCHGARVGGCRGARGRQDHGRGHLHLVWVRSDAATLRARLAARGSGRDAAKLAGFEAFTARMQPDVEPAAPHAAIDNRLSATATLEAQVHALIAALQPAQSAIRRDR